MKPTMSGALLTLMLTLVLSGAAVGADFDPEQATNAYLSSISAQEEANTNAYVDAGYQIMVVTVLLEIAVAFLLLHFGWSRRWREWAESAFKWKFAQAFVYVPIYVLVTTFLLFPLSWYADFYTEHKYGLATQGFGSWMTEFLQGTVLSAIGVALFVAFLYLILRRAAGNWWLWATGLSVSFLILLLFVSPIYIQPIFNDYRPMDEGPLKSSILSIARANGLQAEDVMQVDESRQTNRVSANVSGVFSSARIALNDNLLNRASPEAVEAVMAHEIGHWVLNHIWKSLALFSLIFLLGFAAANLLFAAMVRKKGQAWGIRGVDDYAGFPLLYAIGSVIIFIATPVFFKITYVHEAEADIFAINAIDNPDAWAEVALLTAQYRKLHPPQWEENWLNHHPSPYARVYMAMRWKAEHLESEGDPGEQLTGDRDGE